MGILVEDFVQSLLLAVVADGDNQFVALLGILCEGVGQQVELLAQHRLRLAVGLQGLRLREVVAVAILHNVQLQQLVQELVGRAAQLLGLRPREK